MQHEMIYQAGLLDSALEEEQEPRSGSPAGDEDEG